MRSDHVKSDFVSLLHDLLFCTIVLSLPIKTVWCVSPSISFFVVSLNRSEIIYVWTSKARENINYSIPWNVVHKMYVIYYASDCTFVNYRKYIISNYINCKDHETSNFENKVKMQYVRLDRFKKKMFIQLRTLKYDLQIRNL